MVVPSPIEPGLSGTEAFLLGDWQVEPGADALYRGDEKVHLQPKVMEMLVFLVRNQGRVVSKDEILTAVWPDTFVAEVALTRCISQLRRSLKDDIRRPRYVETIPKKGYRILAPVRPLAGESGSRVKWYLSAAILLSLLAWPLYTGWFGRESPIIPSSPTGINMEPEPQLPGAELGIGLAERVEARNLSRLARHFRERERLEDLERAVQYYEQALEQNPASALSYAGLAEAYLGIGQWGADPEWTAKAEESAARALELDDTLPDAHVAAGMIRLLGYGDFEGAEAAFRQALKLDSRHSNAYREYGLLLLRYLGRLDEALVALKQASDLDPLSLPAIANLGEAYRVRGEYDKAIEAQLRRLEIDPRTLLGYRNAAHTLLLLGKYAEAEKMIEAALDTRQDFEPALQLLVYAALSQGEWGRAEALSRQLLEIDPKNPRSLAAASMVALYRKRHVNGRVLMEEAARLAPDDWCWPTDVRISTLLGYFLLQTGDRVAAERWLSKSLEWDREKDVLSGSWSALPAQLHDIALVYALRGDADQACRWLDRAIAAGWRASIIMRDHPLWGEASLESEHFRRLMAAVDSEVVEMRRRVRLDPQRIAQGRSVPVDE
jgi:DNA-binding winged helix-turn-helix (wHTH) protein/tetratricopeptide (TPR) repeat protein